MQLFVPSTQQALDRITRVAGEALGVGAVCVSLLDWEGARLTSCYGVPMATALLLSYGFRRYMVSSGPPLVVTDGRHDPLVAQNPVVRDGTVTACVVMPFGSPGYRPSGTLVVVDRRPRVWTGPELDLLAKVSTLIMREMDFGAAVRRTSTSR